MKKKLFISNKNETPRMFKNGIVEFLSKTHWTIPILIYVPFAVFCSYYSFKLNIGIINYILLFIAGTLTWTFIEYVIHRFVFHFEPKSKLGKRLHWMFHGVHHDYPQDEYRLVMPPGISLPLAFLFYYLFHLMMPYPFNLAFFSGFILGYLAYDTGHYAIHHFHINNPFLKRIKINHMNHHYVEPERGFGVSSTLWDKVFGTESKRKQNKSARS